MNNPKFRVYDKMKKEWLLGYKEMGGFSLIGEIMLFGEWARILEERMMWLNDLDIMQSTGLKDKNGKEIYEGDIVDGLYGVSGGLQVVWNDHKWSFYSKRDDAFYSPIHWDIGIVVGNIYDNPELLNK
jgi:hypothetical protein